jgi:hypothetical protein
MKDGVSNNLALFETPFPISLPLQHIIHLPHRYLLHRRENMAVDIHRHTNLIISQQFLYYLRMNTHRQKHRRRTMA